MKANETYIWFLFIMSVYVHVAETLVAAALCNRLVSPFSKILLLRQLAYLEEGSGIEQIRKCTSSGQRLARLCIILF